jgi:hypothetical protein
MYVSIKGSIKEVFDSGLKSVALAALTDGIRDAVDAEKSFSTKKVEKTAVVLTANASVSADDKDSPKQLKVAVGIDGVYSGGTTQAFKASGNGKMDGVNVKRLERDVADLIDSVVSDLMKNKVIPQMLKLKP